LLIHAFNTQRKRLPSQNILRIITCPNFKFNLSRF